MMSVLILFLFCHGSPATPTLEEFALVIGGVTFDLTDQFTSTPGSAPDSLEFSLQTTVYDPLDPFQGVDVDATFILDPDPEIVWFVSLYNFSTTNIMARSRLFTGNFTVPVNENSIVRSQIEASSSVTDIWNDGVTIAPHNQANLAVSELFNTTTAINMGVDIGDAYTTTGSGMIPPQNIGWKTSPQGILGPGEMWHGMRTSVSYSLTSEDAAFLAGRTQIQANPSVPEPSTLIFFGAGILGLVLYGWHRRRSA
jgi:hypothetical protein